MSKIYQDNIYYDASDSYVVDKRDYWKLKLISAYPHKKGLDIGSGSGRWLKKFSTWYGIDIDKRAQTNSHVKIGSIEKIPFKKNSFEIVLASHILEHVERKNFERAVSEMHRVLKKRGVLVIFGPNPAHQNFYHDYTHVNPVNVVSLCSVLKNSGFEIIDANYSVYKRFWFGKLLPKGILNVFAPLFMSEYYIVARKIN